MPFLFISMPVLARLMLNVDKDMPLSIGRIAQLPRAAGIHLIVATQRPSTNVVTGLIKANITNRSSFNVASGIDSRVILDTPGAENLIGLGDLLLSKPEFARPQRIQGCYVSEDEINAVVAMLKDQGEPEYHSEILQTNLITLGASQPDGSGGGVSDDDPRINLEHPAPPEGGLFARWAYNGHAGGKGRRGAAERQQAPRSARRRHGARDVEGLRGARRGEP